VRYYPVIVIGQILKILENLLWKMFPERILVIG